MRSSEPGRRPRILYVITNDISTRFLRGQLAYLIEHGFDVAVATRWSEPPQPLDAGAASFDLPYQREPSPLDDLRALAATVRLIRRQRPDIVNASTPKAGLLGMLGARACRVPRRVYVVRGLRFETLTGVRRRALRWLERLATACATDVVYNSPSLLAIAEREGAVRRGRGTILGAGSGNGIDSGRFTALPGREEARSALGLPADATIVGFVGRLTRDKGIVDLVDALDRLDEDTVLLLVGGEEAGDPIPEATRRRIADSPRIVHVPWTDDARLAYRAMDVLAFPSYREGLPNVPLEAQLCEVPVVAYRATGTVDAVAPGNVLVDVGDVDALALGITAALDGNARSTSSSRDWVVASFDQAVIWEALLRVYGGPTGFRGAGSP